jgi:hypothetical protein
MTTESVEVPAGLVCPHCGSAAREATPHSVHYARVDCRECRRFVRWLGRLPRPMPICPYDPARPLSALRGTAAQISAAESIRRSMLAVCRSARWLDIAAVLQRVNHAAWFLANRDRPLAKLKWPGPDQMEPDAGR